jgi:hypothetical protein
MPDPVAAQPLVYELTPEELALAEMALRWLTTKLGDLFERDRAASAAAKLEANRLRTEPVPTK